MTAVATTLAELEDRFEGNYINDEIEFIRLEQLKVLARDPAHAPEVYQAAGLKILAQIAFNRTDLPLSSTEAASIIANALLLRPETQEIFASFGLNEKVVGFFDQREAKHEFVAARVLFLLTYNSSIDFDKLIRSSRLADALLMHLNYHAETVSAQGGSLVRMEQMALLEVTKLLYGLVHKCPNSLSCFTDCSKPLMALLNDELISSSDPLFSSLINALACIDWVKTEDTVVFQLSERVISTIASTVTSVTNTDYGAQLEARLVPAITVLRKVLFANHPSSLDLMQSELLPSDSERDRPLGRSDTLPSRLLRLQLQPTMPNLSEALSGLFFELSGHDATMLIRNIGYGHAAGYLMSHNIPVPEQAHNSIKHNGLVVNPITGQTLDAEQPLDLPEMTEVEKEREAERLFVLFERLARTGAISQHPVAAAQQSGKLEELPDDSPE